MAGSARLSGPACALLRLCRCEAVREVIFGIRNAEQRPRDLRQRRKVASTTLYNQVKPLLALEIVTRRESPGPPWRVYYEFGANGVEFEEVLRGWAGRLTELPAAGWDSPLHCAEAWAAGIVQALLEGPLTAAQIIARCASRATRPQVERLLCQLSADGILLHAGHRYQLVEATRLMVAELAATARFERRHTPAAPAITVDDVVDALRAHLPLLELPEEMEGISEFVIKADPGQGTAMAMAWAEVRGGRAVASGRGKPPRPATGWAQGTIGEWIAAVMDHRPRGLRAAGERRLGKDVIDGLYSRLYRKRGVIGPAHDSPAFSGHPRNRDS